MKYLWYRMKIDYKCAVNYCWSVWWRMLIAIARMCNRNAIYFQLHLTTCSPRVSRWASTCHPSNATLIRCVIDYQNKTYGTGGDESLRELRDAIYRHRKVFNACYAILHDTTDQLALLNLLLYRGTISRQYYLELTDPAHIVYRQADQIINIMGSKPLDYNKLIRYNNFAHRMI